MATLFGPADWPRGRKLISSGLVVLHIPASEFTTGLIFFSIILFGFCEFLPKKNQNVPNVFFGVNFIDGFSKKNIER